MYAQIQILGHIKLSNINTNRNICFDKTTTIITNTNTYLTPSLLINLGVNDY